MNILFVHQNFPGQFKHLAPALVKKGHAVSALILGNFKNKTWNGIKLHTYSIGRLNAENGHPWTIDFESKVIRGEACFREALSLKQKGYSPDVIVAHPGWGESLFLKEVWPTAKLKLYCEFYYHTKGADVGFDPEFLSADEADAGRVTLKNANILLQFQYADAGISPTSWQASTFPKYIRDKISVIHDGIDTDLLSPDPSVRFHLNRHTTLTQADEVITFVNRSLEPCRGFHIFMRSLPKLLSARPNATVLIVGREGVSYGRVPPNGKSWKELLCEEVYPNLTNAQLNRVHFLDFIDYPRFISLLQVSTVHVYLTYPFVLSWSLLEAMSVGCSIIASNTDPLHEIIVDQETGCFVDFFDHLALADKVQYLLETPELCDRIGKAARINAKSKFDLKTVSLPAQLDWVSS
jgi:glycosyltransferase involved in cell wall biosynthesis